MKKEDEIKRLQRLQREQLQARNPHTKQDAINRRLSERHAHRKEKLNARTFLRDMPLRVWYSILGVLIGALLGLIFYALVEATWVKYLALFFVLFGFVAGRVVGAAMEWRSDGWVNR